MPSRPHRHGRARNRIACSRSAAALYGEVRDALREDVAKDAEDPWFVVPWASACVRGAELAAAAGQQTTALELLQPALAHLEAMRGLTHADQWDEPLCRDGLRLAAELQFATGRR